jgi:hypothetical protein
MFHKRILSTFFVVLLSLLTCDSAVTFGQNGSREVPKELIGIAGTFTGSWTSFGIDEKGKSLGARLGVTPLKRRILSLKTIGPMYRPQMT